MSSLHHALTRSAFLMIGIWASGGFFFLGYFGFLWERQGANLIARLGSQVAHVLQAHNDQGYLPQILASDRNADSGRAQPSPIKISHAYARPSIRRVRSAARITFEHPAEPGLVSVVIPTHNRAHIIRHAIDSALGQTFPRLEVVVADDGSSDNTRQVAQSYRSRVTYARQSNRGVSAARNFGMRHARGEFIAFLDSDDAWREWKIEAQITALRRHPEAGLVWTDMAAVDDADQLIDARYLRVMYSAYDKIDIGKTLARVDALGALSPAAPADLSSAAIYEGDLFSAILLGNLIHTSTVLFRRSWCEKTGGFDESYARAGEDYEFYIRLSSAGPAIFVDAPSTLYRIGAADQLTAPSMMLEIAQNNLRAIQKWIPESAQSGLSPGAIRQRFAESLAWVAEAELDAGHRWAAIRRFSQSLALMPGLDRRAALLASCALPYKARDRIRSARRAILSQPRSTG